MPYPHLYFRQSGESNKKCIDTKKPYPFNKLVWGAQSLEKILEMPQCSETNGKIVCS